MAEMKKDQIRLDPGNDSSNAIPRGGRAPLDAKLMKRRRCLFAAGGAALVLLMLLFIIALILALTVFKSKPPRVQLLSAAVEGVAPRISFPVIQVEFNLTLDIKFLVENRNYASFKHGQGKSLLLYQGNQVGEADIYAGLIPARGTATLPCRLTVEVDELASNLTGLINDVVGGNLVMETQTRIPGRINFLGIFKRHAVAVSACQLTISVPNMSISRQTCKQKTRL
ncbi:uncharacterized protein LOC132161969 [Corylus avellana]|uniref:uncharacterized protein LOC132161969 n=1 Tax=Corylus avellana TaxID=13451 RepID=UPI001E1F2DBC|nr:uncharacterized protein LOC132161969 [Corylus avellana]